MCSYRGMCDLIPDATSLIVESKPPGMLVIAFSRQTCPSRTTAPVQYHRRMHTLIVRGYPLYETLE
jgi:hypothetical protein